MNTAVRSPSSVMVMIQAWNRVSPPLVRKRLKITVIISSMMMGFIPFMI